MMLEALFARQNQDRAFLVLTACGVMLGLALHAATALRRARPLAGGLLQGLCAAAGSAMLAGVTAFFRTGLRAYAVLGLLTGMLLYFAGLSRPLDALGRLFQKYKNSRRPKAGVAPADAESELQMAAKE